MYVELTKHLAIANTSNWYHVFVQSEHFPFLGNNVSLSEMRLRSLFYTSLGRLLMVDLCEEEDKFENFMLPLASKYRQLVREIM